MATTQDFTADLSGIPRRDGLLTTPPPANSPLAYNEGTILLIITRIWEIFIALNYVRRDQVAFAPPTGHALDEELLAEIGPLDDRVVSLMRRLPAVRADAVADVEFAPGVSIVSFLKPHQVRRSRDPGDWISWAATEGRTLDPMLPTDVQIWPHIYSDSESWVLDVEASIWAPFLTWPGQ